MSAEPSEDCTYDELCRIVDANGEPFSSLSQCDRFLRAASMLRRREPAEVEAGGERVAKRDLESMIVEARKAREIFLMTSTPTPVICPTDCLR